MKPQIIHTIEIRYDLQCNVYNYYGWTIGDRNRGGITHLYLTGYMYP